MSVVSSDKQAALKGRRILIAEDEYFLGDDIGRTLRSLGAEIVGPFGELTEALAVLNDGQALDGAILDVNVHSEMIFPVARELQARDVPFLFTTGYDSMTLGDEFKDVPHWEKPIDVAAMINALARLIQRDDPTADVVSGSGAAPRSSTAS